MILTIIVLWWLSGFIPFVIHTKITDGKVTLRDLWEAKFISFWGVLFMYFIVKDLIEDTNFMNKDFWDKKIF